MKVSVIICVYNAESTIARTIESILNQTYQNLEIIIINDGSVDGTQQIVEQYIVKYPKNIVMKSIPNGGLANARNHGLTLCSGELYINLDADDYLEPDTFEKAIAVLECDSQIDICFYGYKSFDENGKFFDSYLKTKQYPAYFVTGVKAFQLRMRRHIWICQGNAIYRTELIRKNGIINHPGMNQGEDMYFISRCLLAAKKVAYFQGDNFCCMVRDDSMNHAQFNTSFFQALELLKLLEIDVRRDYPEQLDEILPYIWTERIIQDLAIIKRMARCFTFREYLKQIKAITKELEDNDKMVVWQQLNWLKKMEVSIFRHSRAGYYYLVKAYDIWGKKG